MNKALYLGDGQVYFHCTGCGGGHAVDGRWTFNGDLQRPTITPSVHAKDQHGKTVCHAFIKDGRIQYLSDSTHALTGQTIEMEEA